MPDEGNRKPLSPGLTGADLQIYLGGQANNRRLLNMALGDMSPSFGLIAPPGEDEGIESLNGTRVKGSASPFGEGPAGNPEWWLQDGLGTAESVPGLAQNTPGKRERLQKILGSLR